jgi:hypothetical protein
VEIIANYNGLIKSKEHLVRVVSNTMTKDGILIIEAKRPSAGPE